MVERHGDVGAQGPLDFHGPLGRKEPGASVDVAGELDARLGNGPEGFEREDLKAARVGQHRFGPGGEFVETTQHRHHVLAGAEMQVVGVAENDPGPAPLDLGRVEAADGA